MGTSRFIAVLLFTSVVGSLASDAQAQRYLTRMQSVKQSPDVMNTTSHSLLDYRRMYRSGTAPTQNELIGQWNGVNKGIVEIAGYGQFIKDIRRGADGQIYGDNIQVNQVTAGGVRNYGWSPKYDYQAGDYERRGKFAVQSGSGRGSLGSGATFSYRNGGNAANDPARLLADQVVKIDDRHLLGRATANFGPIKIPLAYFVLERSDSDHGSRHPQDLPGRLQSQYLPMAGH